MAAIPLIRQGILGVTSLFSLIALALSADLISRTQKYFGVTVVFCALGVAVALISLLSLPVMFTIDIMRRGAVTSMIVTELIWLSVLWILWVATAGETISGYNNSFPFGCNYVNAVYNSMCQETQAIAAFSFLNFIILLVYIIFITVMGIIAANRGQKSVWLSSVQESFGSPTDAVHHPMTQYHNASAPAQPQGASPPETRHPAGPMGVPSATM